MELKKILKKAFDAGYDTSLMYNNLGDEAHKDFEEFYKKEVTEQLTLSGVVNCVFVVTERDNYGEQLFKDVFKNKEQAIEFLAKDGLWESNIHEINEIELN